MTQSRTRIPVPWHVRWRHTGVRWVQAILFACSLALLGWMWSGRVTQIMLTGQVELHQVIVPSLGAGMLLAWDDAPQPFDTVHKDVTLLAKIDVADALAEMQVMTAERERLRALLASESERLRLDQRQLAIDDQRQRRDEIQNDLNRQRNEMGVRERIDGFRRELSDLQQSRRELELRLTEAETERVADQQALQGLLAQRSQVDELVQRNMAPSLRRDELDYQVELMRTEVQQSETLAQAARAQIEELNREIKLTQSRLDEAAGAEVAATDESTSPMAQGLAEVGSLEDSTTRLDTETLLAPLSRALIVQDAKIKALAQRIASNEILAPISGQITQVHQPPGTYVGIGDPIVTIASDQGQWIIAYLDQRHHGVLRPADRVEIRLRGTSPRGVASVVGIVTDLGVGYELIPEHLRRNPEMPQWGLPVRIKVPEGLSLLPGEMVDLVVVVPAAGFPEL